MGHVLLDASVCRRWAVEVKKCAHVCDNAVTWAAVYDRRGLLTLERDGWQLQAPMQGDADVVMVRGRDALSS
jgi:hypothetical protein